MRPKNKESVEPKPGPRKITKSPKIIIFQLNFIDSKKSGNLKNQQFFIWAMKGTS